MRGKKEESERKGERGRKEGGWKKDGETERQSDGQREKGGKKKRREIEREMRVEGKSTGRVGRGFNRRVQPQLSLAAFQFLKWLARLLRGR